MSSEMQPSTAPTASPCTVTDDVDMGRVILQNSATEQPPPFTPTYMRMQQSNGSICSLLVICLF
jgi:hypothetical protein